MPYNNNGIYYNYILDIGEFNMKNKKFVTRNLVLCSVIILIGASVLPTVIGEFSKNIESERYIKIAPGFREINPKMPAAFREEYTLYINNVVDNYLINPLDSNYGYVYFDIVPEGMSDPVEILYKGFNYELRIWIENSIILGGMTMGFDITSPDGASWQWINQPDGLGAHGYVTLNEESRMGDGSVFDMTGILVTEQDINELGPADIIMVGGVAMNVGLPAGPLEHMISFHFKANGTGTIRWDQEGVPPCMSPEHGLLFVDGGGGAFEPDFCGPKYWDVEQDFLCGDANGDGQIGVGDIVYLINYVFRDGPAPNPYCSGDANGDADANAADAVFLVSYVFRDGNPPVEPCCIV